MAAAPKKKKNHQYSKRLPIRIEFGQFDFINGDTYEGEFAIDSKSNTIFRQGTGVYKTFEGQVYEGKWLNDKLVINAKISFPSKCSYEGTLSDTPTYLNGTYTFSDNSELMGDFKKLLGGVKNSATFKDPNGIFWDVRYCDSSLELLFPWNWNQTDTDAMVDEDSCDEK